MMALANDWLRLMREWAVPYVMQKRKDLDCLRFIARKSMNTTKALRERQRTDAMFESRVDGTWKYQMVQP